MRIPFKGILDNRRKQREDEQARREDEQARLDGIVAQLGNYPDEGLKSRMLEIVEGYRNEVRRVKGTDKLFYLSHEVSRIEVVTLLYPQIAAAFYNADELRLERETPDYVVTGKEVGEVGGKLVPNIYNVDGRKVLSLRLKKTADGTATRMQILDRLVDGEIGKWHSHPDGIPIPSVNDLFPLSSMDIGLFPHLIATVQESRLYIDGFLRELVSGTLRAQLRPFSNESRRDELIGLGYNQKYDELKYNFLIQHPLFYIPLQKPA